MTRHSWTKQIDSAFLLLPHQESTDFQMTIILAMIKMIILMMKIVIIIAMTTMVIIILIIMVIMISIAATAIIMKTITIAMIIMMAVVKMVIRLLKSLYTSTWRIFRSCFQILNWLYMFLDSFAFNSNLLHILKFTIWITVQRIYYENWSWKWLESFLKSYFFLLEESGRTNLGQKFASMEKYLVDILTNCCDTW